MTIHPLKPLADFMQHGHLIRFKRGEVFQDTEKGNSFNMLSKGYVKRYTIKNDGTHAIQSIYGAGECFPLTKVHEVLLDQSIYNGPEVIYYEGITDVVMYTVAITELKEAADKDPILFKSLLFVSGQRTESNIQRLENNSLLLFYNRVAHQILYLAHSFGIDTEKGREIGLPLSQTTVAEILSSTRETVSLCMKQLKQKNIISYDTKQRITVLDMQALEDEAYA